MLHIGPPRKNSGQILGSVISHQLKLVYFGDFEYKFGSKLFGSVQGTVLDARKIFWTLNHDIRIMLAN